MIRAAIDRLESQLQFLARQRELSPGHARAHRAILRSFADRGAPAGVSAIGEISGADPTEVIATLAELDLIVAVDGHIRGAYPFTLEPTPHRIEFGDVRINAMCALDAVAVAPVFGLEVVTRSECAVTGATVRIHQRGGSSVAHEPHGLRIGVRWQQPHGCAANSICRDMVFLSDASIAERWRGPKTDDAGIFDLDEAIAFGLGFFGPLLDG